MRSFQLRKRVLILLPSEQLFPIFTSRIAFWQSQQNTNSSSWSKDIFCIPLRFEQNLRWICRHGFECQVHHQCLNQFIFDLWHVKKVKINKKRPGLTRLKKQNFQCKITFRLFSTNQDVSAKIFNQSDWYLILRWNCLYRFEGLFCLISTEPLSTLVEGDEQ